MSAPIDRGFRINRLRSLVNFAGPMELKCVVDGILSQIGRLPGNDKGSFYSNIGSPQWKDSKSIVVDG